jgi:hypothetical protein
MKRNARRYERGLPQRPRKPIVAGEKFGYLIAIERSRRAAKEPAKWNCQCICGKTVSVVSGSLRNGNTASCGCKAYEGRTKHGMSKSHIYGIWLQMLARCERAEHPMFHHYGGRGIKVSEPWHEFAQFNTDMSPKPKGMSLERRNNDGPYSKENCVWASQKSQCNNTRRTIRIIFKGRTLSLTQWAEQTGMPKARLRWRYENGWPIAKIFS